MSALCDSTTSLLPVRKILSVVWKPAHRQSRKPSTVLDCLDDPPPKSGVRTWFVVILALTLTYYIYHVSSIGTFSLSNEEMRDIEVVRTVGAASTCVRGCNLEEITNITGINIIDVPILALKGPITSNMCEINLTGSDKLSDKVVNTVNSKVRVKEINASHSDPRVWIGGYYRPSTCRARHRLAVLVPFRNREKNLAIFMFKIHPFLINQNLEYRIFVVEQSGNEKFNKGRLFNAGFEQVHRFGNWSCLVFHDVDLLPLDRRILYTCPTFPRHMCPTVVEFMKIPNYNAQFGGVTAMTAEHFLRVNGYSNMYWGWGGEDFDMFWRIRLAGLPVVRYDRQIARYTMLPHPPEKKNPRRHALITAGFREHRYKKEGLSTVVYKVVSIRLRSLYTHIVVDINPDKELTE